MATAEQRSLLNFNVKNPLAAPSSKEFSRQFRALHGAPATAKDINEYYEQNPEVFRRENGETIGNASKRIRGGRA